MSRWLLGSSDRMSTRPASATTPAAPATTSRLVERSGSTARVSASVNSVQSAPSARAAGVSAASVSVGDSMPAISGVSEAAIAAPRTSGRRAGSPAARTSTVVVTAAAASPPETASSTAAPPPSTSARLSIRSAAIQPAPTARPAQRDNRSPRPERSTASAIATIAEKRRSRAQ